MKIHLIKEETIDKFILLHAGTTTSFRRWLELIKDADWSSPEDILQVFGSADLLRQGSDRVVFNIAGNGYRMICKYAFGKKFVRLYVCWIGTHAQYDRLNKQGEQYTVHIY